GDDLELCARVRHFFPEGFHLIGGDHRVGLTGQYEKPRLDGSGFGRMVRLEPSVECRHRLEVGALPGLGEDHPAAEAVADRTDLARIDLGACLQYFERGVEAG